MTNRGRNVITVLLTTPDEPMTGYVPNSRKKTISKNDQLLENVYQDVIDTQKSNLIFQYPCDKKEARCIKYICYVSAISAIYGVITRNMPVSIKKRKKYKQLR